MRRLTRSRLARTVASMLIALFAGPTLIGWGLALPGYSQITAQTQLQQVAVVPFRNLTKVQPEVLGEKARSALHQALLDTQVYDVRSLEETKQKMADLGLRPPLEEMDFQRLGEALGVTGIVFGEIRSAGIRRVTRSAQGEVVLMVGIFDVSTRTTRGGTIVTGHSSFATGEVNADTLIDEAINQATYQAIKDIQSHRPISGLVQWADHKDVVLSVGQTQGVLEGMKFVVLRDGQRVGIVEVSQPQRATSLGRLVEGQARTSDRVREVFVIPAKGPTPEVPGESAQKKRGMNKLLLALAAGLLLASFTQGKGGKSSTEGLSAAAVSNPTLVSIGAIPQYAGDPFSLTPMEGAGAIIQMRWSSPRASREIVHGYEIWRDGRFHWFELGPSGQGRVFTDPLTGQVDGKEVTVEIDPLTGTGRAISEAGLAHPVFSVDEAPSRLLSLWALNAGVAPTSIVYSCYTDWVGKEYEIGDETVEFIIYVGPSGGTHRSYLVRKLTSQRLGTVSTAQAYEIVRETPEGRPAVATFVGPPQLSLPPSEDLVADPTAVTFGFNGVPGADDYIFQASLDSQFAPSATVSDNLTNIDGIHSPSQLLLFTKDLTTMLGSLPSGTTVFWRVGARWRGDTTPPFPYPMVGKMPSDSFRYVFSDSRRMSIQ